MKYAAQIIFSIVVLILFATCKDKNGDPCKPQEYSYHTITDEAKSKVPYLKSNFDTISYLSNKGDTLVFVRQPKDSSWYCKNHYPNVDCLLDWDCYENYGAKYTCIKGVGNFEFKHGKEIYIKVNSNTRPDNDYDDMIEFKFNNLHLIFCDCVVNDISYKKYIGDTIIGYTKYSSAFYEFHEFENSKLGKGFYNKEYGLFHIEDNVNNVNWTILRK